MIISPAHSSSVNPVRAAFAAQYAEARARIEKRHIVRLSKPQIRYSTVPQADAHVWAWQLRNIDMHQRTLASTTISSTQMVRRIQTIIAKQHGITPEDLRSQSRKARYVKPRMLAVYIARHVTPRSLLEIGRLFGGRDHTTILNCIRRIEEKRRADPAFDAEVWELLNLFEMPRAAEVA